jgi:hypothetical protein
MRPTSREVTMRGRSGTIERLAVLITLKGYR